MFPLYRFFLLFQAHHAPPASRTVPTTAPITAPAMVPGGVASFCVLEGVTVTVAGDGGGDCDVVEPGEAEDRREELAAAVAEEVVDSLEILK